ncbi:HD domain-containing protein [Streptomyces sp. S6]
MAQVARRALLIGVGRAPETVEVLEPLEETVGSDLRLLEATLRGSGYEVEVLPDAGRSRIKLAIDGAARQVPSGGTLLLYFSGHGLRVGGTDYLVPADAIAPADGVWSELHLDSLMPANISPLLRGCEAGTVLWFIDACRTELVGDGVQFANQADSGPPRGGFAVMAGCSAGEYSGYTGEGSFFAKGLAEALGPMTPARTVEDVLAAARAATVKSARRHGVRQTPWFRYGTYEEERTRKTEICEGRALLEAWQGAVRETPLWNHVEECERAALVGVLEEFAEDSARVVHRAQERLPDADPWVDDAFPVRVLRDRLPELLPPDLVLSAVEVIALVAAPFLHEVAWAERVSQAVEVQPYDVSRRGGSAHRLHYEQIVEQHGRIARKLADCRARGRVEDVAALTMWLVHRWIADRFETDDEVMPVASAVALASRLGLAEDRALDLGELLRAVASGVGSDEVWGASRKVLLPGKGHQVLRVGELGSLLRLASLLAVDVRVLPDVVADHLAVSDAVLPQQVVGVARELSWHREGSALHLDALCPHQAVHAALVEVVEEADRVAGRVSGGGVLADVPGRVTDRDLRPSRIGGRESYEVPLLRFHLAQTEVRELLMGEQLYGGEPELALRELYQNAMDACRYREMRWRYLESVGAHPVEWSGRIVFSQGEDERGRYVECRDNGVGMSREQLKQTFTRAGSRFERSSSFRREQSKWLRHDPELRLYPNSRFGIGVFSYFMLAEEMSIVTRQVSPEGIPAEYALRVDIPSSGSLFRVQRHDGRDDGVAEGGTRVRLYLREDERIRDLSCVRVLQDLVWVSEFRMEAKDSGGLENEWSPGALQAEELPHAEAVPGMLWWVDGGGAILCDGIATDQEPFGYVVNLSGEQAGKLSVSRKELQGYDARWVESLWRRGAGVLPSSSLLSQRWTWRLDQRSPAVARVLDSEWRGEGVRAEVPGRKPTPLDQVGWFHRDEALIENPNSAVGQGTYLPWRAKVFGMSQRYQELAAPADLAGYPVPVPGDADLVQHIPVPWHHVLYRSAVQETSPEHVQRRLRGLRVMHQQYAPLPHRGETVTQVPENDALLKLLDPGSGTMSQVVGGDGALHWGSLIALSARSSLSLGELVRQLTPFQPLLPTPLPVVPEHHQDYVCTNVNLQRIFLLAPTGKTRPVRALPTTAMDLHQVAKNVGLSVLEVLQDLTDFSWLGWTVPTREAILPWTLLDNDLQDVVDTFVRGDLLPWAATVDFADTLGTDLRTAEKRLAQVAADLGLCHERRYVSDTEAARVRPSVDAAILVRRLAFLGVVLENGLTVESLSLAYVADSGIKDPDLAMADLRRAGVDVPDDISIVLEWHALPLHDRYVLSGTEPSLTEEDYPADELTSAILFNAANSLNETLGEVWDSASAYTERFGFALPHLPASLVGFHPAGHMVTALMSHLGNPNQTLGTPVWKPLRPRALAAYAHHRAIAPATAYAQLLPLREIGALIPAHLEDLPTQVPDQHDLLALDETHRVTPPTSPYTPLDLLSIAARLGEPLPRTAARITPYLPLTETPTPLPTTPDLIPLWQDLSILTRHLDGLLPALEGQVTHQHIQFAAEATGMTETWVTNRLSLYADMFNLTLDQTSS